MAGAGTDTLTKRELIMNKALSLRVLMALQDKLSGPLKKVAGEAGVSGRQIDALRERLRTLNASQRDIGEFRSLSTGLQNSRSASAAAQQRVNALAQQLSATQNPTRALQMEFAQAKSSAQQLQQEVGQQTIKLQGLRDRLSSVGISTKKLKDHEATLSQNISQTNTALSAQTVKLKATSQQQEKLSRARAAARASMERGRSIAGNAAAAGARGMSSAAALSRPLGAVVNAFAPAEDAATQLKMALMGGDGKVSEDFQKITDLATRLGDKLPGTTADFQNMMTLLRQQGMSSTAILGGLGEATAFLGVQLKMPGAEAAAFAAKMQSATRTVDGDMMGLMDVVQRTFNIGTDSGNLLQGFASLSPALNLIGKDGLEASKMLAPLLVMMDQTGMAGESAGNALSKVFQAGLQEDKVSKANAAMKDKGISLDFTNGAGEFGGIDQLFAQLEKLEALTSAQRTGVLQTLFGDDAATMQVVNTMMAKGVAGYQDVVGKMNDQGSINQRVEAQLGTLSNVADAAKGNLTEAMVAIGATAAPALKNLLNGVGAAAARLGQWAQENPQLTATIVKVVAIIAALSATFGAVAYSFSAVMGPLVMMKFMMAQMGVSLPAVSSVFGVLAKSIGGVGGVVMTLGRLLLTNPIGIALLAIGAAAFVIYQYWTPISAFFSGLWATITGIFSNAWTSISTAITGLWTTAKTAFSNGLTGIGTLILSWSPLTLFTQAMAGVMSYFGIEMPGKFSEFGGMLLQGLMDGITNMMGVVKDAITNLGSSVVGWFKEKLSIKSPSRVFMEMGEFVSEGAAIGITNAQPMTIKAAQALAASVAVSGALAAPVPPGLDTGNAAAITTQFDTRPALSASGAGKQTIIQGDTITIHIQAIPGMSADDLSRAVDNVLRQRDREKEARLRSSFSDN